MLNTLKRTLQVAFLMAPRVLALREIREKTLKGKEVDEEWVREEARKLVNAMVKLGPTFIKFGQGLSVHSDIFPEAYLKELAKLQDQVQPAPWDEVKDYVFEDLKTLGIELAEIDTNPISSASIGQVYLAKTKDGKQVVLKVRRPRIEELVKTDIEVIKRLSPFLKFIFGEAFYENFRIIVTNFTRNIFEEMDFEKEARYMKAFKEELREFPDVKVPELIGATKRVIVMEYLPGYKVTSEEAKKVVPPKELAYRVFRTFMVMLLEKEYFHADPHPGNIAVDKDGNLILYDYGMIGKLDKTVRNKLLRVYAALVRLDGPMLVKALEELGAVDPTADREMLVRGLELFLSQYKGIEPSELEVETFLKAANEVFYRFPLRLPEALVLYIRMTSELGGTCTQIDPDFNFFDSLVRLIDERGLLLTATIDEVKTVLGDIVKKFKMSLLEKPLPVNHRRRDGLDYLVGGMAVLSVVSYLIAHDVNLALLIALASVAVSMRRK